MTGNDLSNNSMETDCSITGPGMYTHRTIKVDVYSPAFKLTVVYTDLSTLVLPWR